MNVLVDSDIFCKLAMAELLEPTLRSLQCELKDCRRLPALPHMLRRGRLRDSCGVDACNRIADLAITISAVGVPGDQWLDSLVSVPDIDPGEAQLFAKAAEEEGVVMTGDKRSLQALSKIPGLAEALHGKIVVLEAILLRLCSDLGVSEVSRLVRPIRHLDTTLRVCFSDSNTAPIDGLSSYWRTLLQDVHPLVLWNHERGR